ncbi:MAG: Gfo/Idh/MocA family oxidoreductase [Isosphaeraceae bacterium]
MPPISLNRRRFLSCSAAAGIAISQGNLAEGGTPDLDSSPVRLGFIGIGNRGTALLRAAIELPGTSIVAICDPEPKHRQRGQGIVEKAQRHRPEAFEDPRRLLDRPDVDAVVAALPCDLHESVACQALAAGKHVYLEKPMALTAAGCERILQEAGSRPDLAVHVGFQRRSNPRFQEGVRRIKEHDLGPLIEARGSWTSSNGPLTGTHGWLGRRARSGDFMVEQAVHIWDVLNWIQGGLPVGAVGWGRKGLFARLDPDRDVTDHYSVELEWAGGFRASFTQSWIAPADDGFTGSSLRVMGEAGGLDFATGSLTFRDRQRPRETLAPGAQNDTRFALLDFLSSIRAEKRLPPPLSLRDARDATLTGLLVRAAIDQRRLVTMDEIRAGLAGQA